MDDVAHTTLADATEAAILRVTEVLRHPDQLVNMLPLLKKKYNVEKATVDAQLKTILEQQLDDSQRGLDTLISAKKETGVVQQNLMDIDRQCLEAQTTMQNYQVIRLVHPMIGVD